MKTCLFLFSIISYAFIANSYALEENIKYGLIYPLKEGSFNYIKNAKLKSQTRFFSGVDDINCHSLYIENQNVGWIFYAFKTTSMLLLYKCKKSGAEYKPIIPNTINGERDSTAIYTAVKSNGKWSLPKIPIPDYDNFSNHSICNNNIAYWGAINNTHFASVFNLKEMKIVKKVKVSEYELRTDDEGFFPKPIWSESCDKIIYPKHYDSNIETVIHMQK